MKKRLLICLLAVLCLLSLCLPETAFAVSTGTCGENVTWNLTDGVLTISGSGEMTSAPWSAFPDQIKTVVIQNGVASIASEAFSNCSQLTSATIPVSVTDIGAFAFSDCNSLASIAIPEGVNSISNNTFYNCTSLKSVTLPNSIRSIGNWAFYNCTSLTGISIPDGVSSIGDAAFYGCSSLTRVTIPASVTSIGSGAFHSCSALNTIDFKGDAPAIGGSCFANVTAVAYYPPDNATWTLDKRMDYGGTITWVASENPNFGTCGENLTWKVENGILTISGTGAMKNYSSKEIAPWGGVRSQIKKVVISDGVTSIGSLAFVQCEQMTEITIPNTVSSIGPQAFLACSSLTSVTIPRGVTAILELTFERCEKLQEVVIPDSVTQIDLFAFALCPSLTKLVFSGNAPIIDDMAFSESNATAYYPRRNDTWTEGVMQDYGGSITWVAQCGSQHYEVTDPAVAPTCTQTGLTEGKHCADCGIVTVAQEVVPATGHSFGEWKEIKPATTTQTGLEERSCASCGATEQKLLAKLEAPDTESPTNETNPVPTEAAAETPTSDTDPAPTEAAAETPAVSDEVTEDATAPAEPTSASITAAPDDPADSDTVENSQPPALDAQQNGDKSGTPWGAMVGVLAVLAACGAAAWYFLIWKKKT